MKKRILSILLVFLFAVSVMPLSFAEATDTVGRTAYTQVFKSGKTAYCSGRAGLYKITLKNGRPKKIRKLVKFDGISGAMEMIKNGNYIYYLEVGTAAGGFVYRVNVTTGKKKRLTDFLGEGEVTVVNNTLYYSQVLWADYEDVGYDTEGYDVSYYDEDGFEYFETVAANLDGSYPEVVNVKIHNPWKRSNAKSYRVYSKRKGRYYYDYLKTPKGKFYIGKARVPAGF